MSTLDPNKLRRELLLEQAIKQRLDELVRQANKTDAKLKSNKKMEENQLRNLLNVAMESRSAEVVTNFIRYQIGRNESAWQKDKDGFGHTVIADIHTFVAGLANDVVEYLKDHGISETEAGALRSEASIRLMQLYLGYLNRAFYYGKKANGFDHLKEIAQSKAKEAPHGN